MATSPMPGSEERPRRDERVASSAPARAEIAQPVDKDTIDRIRQAELDERWRLAGREE